MSANGTLVEAKLCTFTLESTHFVFNMCPIYTHDDAGAKLALTHTKRITVYEQKSSYLPFLHRFQSKIASNTYSNILKGIVI